MQQLRHYLFRPAIAMAFGLAAPLYANAALMLPPPNELTVITYNNFDAYSFELLEKCKDDTRCQPASPNLDKIGGGPGQIADFLVLLSSSNNKRTNDNARLVTDGLVDDAFRSPTGDGEAFLMGIGNEPGGINFDGDRNGSWDIQIGALTDWLFGNDLVFMLNNNQSGDNINQWLQAFAQVKIYDEDGAEKGCFEFSNRSGGCGGEPNLVLVTDPAFNIISNAGDYVGVFTGYCVDKDTGAAFDLGLAGNDQYCSSRDGYFVSGNLGNFADNAIYSQALSEFIYGADPSWIMSVDIRLANNTNGGEYIWISNQFGSNIPPPPPPPPFVVSAPGTLLLLGAGLLGLRTVRRRAR